MVYVSAVRVFSIYVSFQADCKRFDSKATGLPREEKNLLLHPVYLHWSTGYNGSYLTHALSIYFFFT